MIEINAKAKKDAWGKPLASVEAVHAAMDEGQHIGMVKLNEHGMLDELDHLVPINKPDSARITKWMNQGILFCPHNFKKVVVYQTVIIEVLPGKKYIRTLWAASRAKLDMLVNHPASCVVDKMSGTPIRWSAIDKTVSF